nr:hypothetical protein [Tanacetum cinerariifolium]
MLVDEVNTLREAGCTSASFFFCLEASPTPFLAWRLREMKDGAFNVAFGEKGFLVKGGLLPKGEKMGLGNGGLLPKCEKRGLGTGGLVGLLPNGEKGGLFTGCWIVFEADGEKRGLFVFGADGGKGVCLFLKQMGEKGFVCFWSRWREKLW